MPFRPVPERLGVRFSHELTKPEVKRHIGYATYKSRYAVTEAALQRSDSGIATATLECGECGKRVDFRMFETGRTRRYRALWLLLFLACPAVLLALYALTSDSDSTAAIATFVISIPLLLIAAIICAVVWWNEEGVRYKQPKIDGGPLHILEVGRMTAAWRPAE